MGSLMSNLERMRVYLDRHGPEPAGRTYVAEAAHILTLALTAGRGNSPGTPVDTREARGGWRFGTQPTSEVPPKAAFYSILGALEVDQVLILWRPGVALFWWNNVLHLLILAGGRRPDRNGRMIGSIQAPDGWIEQSHNEMRGHMRGWNPSGKVAGSTGTFARSS